MPTYNFDATFLSQRFVLFFTQRFFLLTKHTQFQEIGDIKAICSSPEYLIFWYLIFCPKIPTSIPKQCRLHQIQAVVSFPSTCAETPVQSTPNRKNKKVQWKCRTPLISKIFYLNTLNKVGCSEILFLRQENLHCGWSKENITQRWNIW